MAKRFNISLPDDLVRRLESIKTKISLSEVMQNALEKELSTLLMSDADKIIAEALTARAKEFWAKDRLVLHKGVSAFVDHLIDAAIQDHEAYIFRLYQNFRVHTIDQLIVIIGSTLYDDGEDNLNLMHPLTRIGHFIANTDKDDQLMAFWDGYMGNHLLVQDVAPQEREWGDREILVALKEEIERRIKYYLGEEAIETYLS